MKLKLLHEAGHWKTVSGSGYTDPKDKETDKKERDLSMLAGGKKDREKFLKWWGGNAPKGPGELPTS